MAYPYSKAGGGISSVAWGDITGTLSDQIDLQAALDLKQDVGGGGDVVLSDTFWAGYGDGGQALIWSGTQWQASNNEGGSYAGLIRVNNGWIDGLRPTTITLLVNSGEESSWSGRTYSGHQVVVYGPFNEELVAAQSIPWTDWEQDQEVVLTPDFVTNDVDISRFHFLTTNLLSTGPIIKSITFNYD